MKNIFLTIGIILQLVFQMNDLQWIIEPKYDEIIVYGKESFVVKENGKYKVLDYKEKTLYEFNDKEIKGLMDHPNEGGELQELIQVRYQGDKMKLFNIKKLDFIHENKYYLLQTDYYEPERRLIRVFDELKEGVMDFDGNIIFYPIYEGVIVEKEFSIGFKEEEILISDNNRNLVKKLPYLNKGSQYIKDKKLFQVQKSIKGETNVFQEVRKHENGRYKINYEKSGSNKFVSGLVDMDNNIVIPFTYSSIDLISNNYLEVTKDEKISEKGFVISYFKPKFGIIDFFNNEVLPLEYKYIGTIEGDYVLVENFDEKRAVFNLEKREFETDFIFNNYEEAAQKITELDNSNSNIEYKINGLVGLKNRQNDILIPAKYRGIHQTMNPEIYIVYGPSDDEYGYEGYYHIGLNKEIVPTLFADRGGIGGYKRNNQNDVIKVMDPETSAIGFYKIDGTKISDTIFDEYVEGFSEDLAPVYGDFSDKTGMIDIDGNVIYDYIFDSMTLPYDGKSIVRYNGKYGILNLKK